MKPLPQISRNQRGSRRGNRARGLLATNYNYQPTVETPMGSSVGKSAAKSPAFRKISSRFLKVETSQDYVAELFFFVLMTVTAAWPIVSMLIAVSRLIRGY
jgi:hypothetical protein